MLRLIYEYTGKGHTLRKTLILPHTQERERKREGWEWRGSKGERKRVSDKLGGGDRKGE